MEGRVDRALLLGICTPILTAKDRRRAWSQLSFPKPGTGSEKTSPVCECLPARATQRWVLPVRKRQVCACTSLRPVASLPSIRLTALPGDQGVNS